MFIKSSIIALALASAFPGVLARELIYERDGRAFYPRRFGQEQCGGIGGQIGATCNGAVCGVLGGRVPGTLLAAADPCAQQDLADDIINASKQQNAATAAKMVNLAVKFRQCEKNTPPDFSKNPPALRNSVFCLKAPANPELNGLVQGQDPANDPNLFFDVATGSTVLRGSQANTFPFGQGGGAAVPPPFISSSALVASPPPAATQLPQAPTSACPSAITVTVTPPPAAAVSDVASTASCPAPTTVTVTSVDNKVADSSTVASPSPTVVTPPSPPPPTGGALSFGTCTNPTVEFGPGFEGRKLSENSFEPVNKAEFNQASALNGQIVLTAICNILNDKCKAPAATVTACRNAIGAVGNVVGGAKADQFNAALGITTDFATVPAAPGGGPGSAALASTPNFNKCAAPKIAFGIFDGRTENSFAPVGNDFQHGSALNPAIITQFVCDQLVNKCDANTVAIDNCARAITATNGKTGQALVDAFNSAVTAGA